MLFILYGGHTGMGNAGRNFFRQNGVSIVKKYHYCDEAPELTTFYESRNFVDKLTFYENTDPMYRYKLGNIHTGFSRLQIVDAVSGKADYLLTLSTQKLDIIKELKFTYKDAVQVIYAYTDDATLSSIFASLDISKEEFELRCNIGRMIKACYRSNPALFDYTIVYGGEDSPFDYENMVSQYNTFYIKTQKAKDGTHEELLKCVQEIKRTVTETNQTVLEMNETLKTLVDFFQNGLQGWLQHEKQLFSQTVDNVDDEGLIAATIARTNYYINERVGNAECLVQRETENLRQIFGTTWERLLPSTRTSLISSGILWKSCADMGDQTFDYSGICITSTTALENELKAVFYTGFQVYLEKKYGNPSQIAPEAVLDYWPKELLDEKTMSQIGDNFTLGKLPYLFSSKRSKNIRREMNSYLRTVLKARQNSQSEWWPIDTLDRMSDMKQWARDPNSFISRCEQIRYEYRNPAAHSGVISRETAEACTIRIVGKMDAYIHSAKVQGLIMELYSYLK